MEYGGARDCNGAPTSARYVKNGLSLDIEPAFDTKMDAEYKTIVRRELMKLRAKKEAADTFRKQELAREERERRNGCYRCGRTSHWVADCFASRHVDGSILDD